MADAKGPVVSGGEPSVAGSKTSSSLRLDRAEAFAGGGDVRFYRPIAGYEGLHRYDPREQWTPREEKKLVRKVGGRWSTRHGRRTCLGGNSRSLTGVCGVA